MGKTKEKWRLSPKQKQTKEQVPQRGFKEAHVLAVVNKGQKKKKKRTYTKQKQTEEQVPQRGSARRHSFRTMKNPTTKNNPGSFLEVALS